jgi:thiamine-phosphate pyrophosphorylase
VENCRLYLVTPPKIDLKSFTDKVKDAFGGGDIACIQLRLKDATDDDVLRAAELLMPIAHAHDTAFIINDRADLAMKCGADGVHLGQEDMTIVDAREILGEDRIIGKTAHASPHLAMEAGEDGADYVAFGAFYPTTSKPKEKIEKWGVPAPDILSWWQENTVLPCVAIGGITPANCWPLVAAGADFVAAITSVWNHEKSPGAAVKEFNSAIKRVKANTQ